ncbi:hypothetical protein EGW08_004449 [Elysia chlorotica]|uniref:Uncharacterized protein n=1 Tax=Elysia chlorotica TaxID=188477 RepID=A0A433U1R5_ELYCH|nr:hypothetical protein EGW08_004449 [Elysia chlorotica]
MPWPVWDKSPSSEISSDQNVSVSQPTVPRSSIPDTVDSFKLEPSNKTRHSSTFRQAQFRFANRLIQIRRGTSVTAAQFEPKSITEYKRLKYISNRDIIRKQSVAYTLGEKSGIYDKHCVFVCVTGITIKLNLGQRRPMEAGSSLSFTWSNVWKTRERIHRFSSSVSNVSFHMSDTGLAPQRKPLKNDVALYLSKSQKDDLNKRDSSPDGGTLRKSLELQAKDLYSHFNSTDNFNTIGPRLSFVWDEMGLNLRPLSTTTTSLYEVLTRDEVKPTKKKKKSTPRKENSKRLLIWPKQKEETSHNDKAGPIKPNGSSQEKTAKTRSSKSKKKSKESKDKKESSHISKPGRKRHSQTSGSSVSVSSNSTLEENALDPSRYLPNEKNVKSTSHVTFHETLQEESQFSPMSTRANGGITRPQDSFLPTSPKKAIGKESVDPSHRSSIHKNIETTATVTHNETLQDAAQVPLMSTELAEEVELYHDSSDQASIKKTTEENTEDPLYYSKIDNSWENTSPVTRNKYSQDKSEPQEMQAISVGERKLSATLSSKQPDKAESGKGENPYGLMPLHTNEFETLPTVDPYKNILHTKDDAGAVLKIESGKQIPNAITPHTTLIFQAQASEKLKTQDAYQHRVETYTPFLDLKAKLESEHKQPSVSNSFSGYTSTISSRPSQDSNRAYLSRIPSDYKSATSTRPASGSNLELFKSCERLTSLGNEICLQQSASPYREGGVKEEHFYDCISIEEKSPSLLSAVDTRSRMRRFIRSLSTPIRRAFRWVVGVVGKTDIKDEGKDDNKDDSDTIYFSHQNSQEQLDNISNSNSASQIWLLYCDLRQAQIELKELLTENIKLKMNIAQSNKVNLT